MPAGASTMYHQGSRRMDILAMSDCASPPAMLLRLHPHLSVRERVAQLGRPISGLPARRSRLEAQEVPGWFGASLLGESCRGGGIPASHFELAGPATCPSLSGDPFSRAISSRFEWPPLSVEPQFSFQAASEQVHARCTPPCTCTAAAAPAND